MVKPPPVPRNRSGTRPPPPPGRRSDIKRVVPQVDESTQRVTAPQDFGFADELVGLLSAETEALLTSARSDNADERLADMNLRLALIAWDLSDDIEGAERYLELADRHPVAPRLLFQQALTVGSIDALDAAHSVIEGTVEDPQARGLLLRDLAEAWLYRLGDLQRAVDCARDGLATVEDHGLIGDLQAVLCDALYAAEDWDGLVEALIRSPLVHVEHQAEAAQVTLDRLGDVERCAEILEGVSGASPALAFHVAGLQLEAGLADPSPEGATRVGLALARRLELLDATDGAVREAAATRYLYVQHLADLGDSDAAVATLEPLAETASDGDAGAWGPRLASLTRFCLLVRQEGWREAALLLESIAKKPGAGILARSHLRRAAELFEARAENSEKSARAMWRALFEATGDERAARAIERELRKGDPVELLSHLEAAAKVIRPRESAFLRRAAIAAEVGTHDLIAAIRLRRSALAADAGDVSRHDDLVRLCRMSGERGQLAELYRELAVALSEPRASSAYYCAAAALELLRGREAEAEALFGKAAEVAPDDVAAYVGLAVIMRRTDRPIELAKALTQLAELCEHSTNQFDALRELADLYSGPLSDSSKAAEVLERALALRPGDVQGLHSLARLYDSDRAWDRAVEVRRDAVELATEQSVAAELLLEIGGIEEGQRQDDAAALAAYEQVLELEPASPAALEACARQHRKHKRLPELVDILRRQAQLLGDPQRLLAIHIEIAEVLEALGEGDAVCIEALQAALAIDSTSEPVLRKLEVLATRSEDWDAQVSAFRAAPETVANLRALASAYEHTQDWPGLADVLVKQIELTSAREEKSALSSRAAELFADKLGRVDDALRMYNQAVKLNPKDSKSQAAVVRLLEQNGRWRELGLVWERELAALPSKAVDQQVALLLKLGELRQSKLGKSAEAAAAYEMALERQPKAAPALAALEELYTSLGRNKDLVRVLQTKAEMAGAEAGAALNIRIAGILEQDGDIDGALSAYQQAFAAQPGNRETFNAFEKLAYRHEQWGPVMAMYNQAIELVENGKLRAYRLADLYARRGEVQLRYLQELGEAAVSYSRVVDLEPDNDEALTHLEQIYSQQNDWAGLIAAHEKRAKASKDPARRAQSLRSAARMAQDRLEDPAETMRLFQALLEVDPSDEEAIGALERYYDTQGSWEQLVAILRSRISTVPPGDASIALLLRIAQVCEDGLRDDDRAIEYYQRVLKASPSNKTALEALGRIYESTERWADFIDVTRRQIKVTSDRNVKALLYFKCGSVMEAKFGKEDDAIRYYDAAIKTSPACLPAVHGVRDLYRRRKDWPRVIQTLELEVKLWQDDKERAGVFAQIGRIYADHLGQPERGLHYYESALAVDPDCVPANRALFDQYFDSQQWDRAQPLAQALAQKAMRDGDPTARSEFYRKRGIVIWKTGDPNAAADSIIIALEIKPNNVQALDALGELARVHPDAFDFDATYRELDKIYRKRDDSHALLARVKIAQAVIEERDGDLDAAETLYEDAAALCPHDFAVLSARVDLFVAMRRWQQATDSLRAIVDADPPPGPDIRVQALMRIAEIQAEGEMDASKAITTLQELIRFDESVVEAHYLLAQEYFVLDRFAEARAAIERVIELAAAPGLGVSPEQLARYYYYLGRIIERGGDSRAATSHYRRAAEYDPGYAPPALALAARAADAGDQAAAETLLIDAAHAAMQSTGEHAAVPLQRGLARILLAAGDRQAAIEAYRGILAVEPDNAADRIALAEIYAQEDMVRAIDEVKQVIQRDLRHGPAYRLLASFYARAGETERGVRVLTAMEALGYAGDADRGARAKALAEQQQLPLRSPMTDDLRRRFLLTRHSSSPLGELFDVMVGPLTALFPEPPVGNNLVPLVAFDQPDLHASVLDAVRLFGIEPEIYIGHNVPRSVVAIAHPRPVIVIDAEIAAGETDAARRFVLGWSFDAIRGGYALLQTMGRRQRVELGGLLKSILLPENERPGPTSEFIQSLSRPALRTIETLTGMGRGADSEDWIDGMLAIGRRAGLLMCDDFATATRVIARLGGENLGHADTQALALVMCGEDLVRFYLSDEYHRLRETVCRTAVAPTSVPGPT